MTLNSISPPLTVELTAIDESTTIITTAKDPRLSAQQTPTEQRLVLEPQIVERLDYYSGRRHGHHARQEEGVDGRETETMPDKKPTAHHAATMIIAVTTADPPALTSFLNENSSPSEKSSTTMPIWAQNSILPVGSHRRQILKWGLARNPATI